MNVAFAKLEVPTSGAVIAGVFADNKLTPSASKLDRQTRGAISRAIAASRFTSGGAPLPTGYTHQLYLPVARK